MMPEIKDTPENIAYRVGKLEEKDDKDDLRIQALELWKASVEEKVNSIKSGGSSVSPYAPTATQWLKIIATILTLLGVLIGYITQVK